MTTKPATGRWLQHSETNLVVLEILNRAFVLLRGRLTVERSQIFSFTRFGIFLARIQPILTGFQLPNHNDCIDAWITATQVLRGWAARHHAKHLTRIRPHFQCISRTRLEEEY